MRYADLHSDALTCDAPENFLENTKEKQISLETLVKGDCFLECFALFSDGETDEAWEQAKKYLSAYKDKEKSIKKHLTPVLTVEGGGATRGKRERLETLFSFGVKIFGLTWNNENAYGYPCGTRGGLKRAGKKLLPLLEEKGIFADVSHLSDDGISDVLFSSFRPVVATHSLSRSVFSHRRNLTDGQIKGIADSGGVVGVCFVRAFLGNTPIEAHLKRIYDVGGEDVLAIGSDFDGTKNPIVKNPKEMPIFLERMAKLFSPRIAEKLAYKNVLRLLSE